MTIPTVTSRTILSGIQPTGDLNIGGYLGALRQWVAIQREYRCFFCIVDLHALTVRQDPEELRRRTRELAALYIACGIDPTHSVIFIQSHVPEHCELAWVLGTFTMMGELEKMTQFKDKAQRHKTNVNSGLFSYPVLMAADILLYQAGLVPVGADQKQHLELARNVAVRVNNAYNKPLFVVPEPYIPPTGARVMDLQSPTDKMSKSLPPAGRVGLLEPADAVLKKFRRAVTDLVGVVNYDPTNQPGVANLLNIYAAIRGGMPEERARDFEGKGYKELKDAVADSVIELCKPVQARYAEIVADPHELDNLLARGAEAAREVAATTLRNVYETIGLIAPVRRSTAAVVA